jgi:photosystem II stability/assembly factor-like uncharacterized protein
MPAPARIRVPARRLAAATVLLITLALQAGGRTTTGVAECDPPGPVSLAEGPGPTPVELEVVGRVARLSVSPAGRLWLTTYMGNTYHADSVGGYWRYGPIQGPDPDSIALSGDPMDAVAFFTPDTAFIWGYIGTDHTTEDGLVLRTTDGGATWDSVPVAGAGWIHDAFASPAGEAWMSGSSGLLLYTADFGASWTVRSRPFRSQLIAIHMGPGGVGLAGSIDEGLRITRDGGTTWRSVPTPQQQGRYPPPPRREYEEEDDPEEMTEVTEVDTVMEPVSVEEDDTMVTVPMATAVEEDTMQVVAPSRGRRAAADTFPDPGTTGGQARIDRVGLFGGRAVITQGGRVFHSALDSIDWQPLPGDSLVLFAVSRDGAGLAGVTRDGRLVRYDAALRPSAVPGARMYARPLDLVSQGGILYALDEQGAVYRADERGLVHGYPLTGEHPLRAVYQVRREGARLWGTTANHVYTSDDDGRTWARRGDVPFAIRGFAVRGTDELLMWDGHGGNVLFDARTGASRTVESLNGDDVIGVVRRDSVWAAFGGMQYESAGRVEVSRTFFPGEFAGTRPHGFVYLSRDRGAIWTRVDTWPDAGVAQLWMHPDGGMVLFSWLGSVRGVARSGAGWSGATLHTATGSSATPYVQQPLAAYFTDARHGWVSGNIHNVGFRAFETDDGGRTWRSAGRSGFPFVHLEPFGAAYLASTPREVFRLDGGARTPLYAAPWPQEQWEWPVSMASPAGDSVLVATFDRGMMLVPATGGAPRCLAARVRVFSRSMH